jgi:sestrin
MFTPSSDSSDSLNEEFNFYSFFGDLLSSDSVQRSAAISSIVDRLSVSLAESNDSSQSSLSSASARTRSRRLLFTHLPSVVRLSLECPFSDVRDEFHSFLQTLCRLDQTLGNLNPTLIGPSCFIQTDKAPLISSTESLSSSSSDTFIHSQRQLFEDIFLATGRVSHVDQLMGWHPSFASLFAQSMQFIMDDNGPLPQPWRHFIAIMAAGRHKCEYLVRQQEWEFISKGGNKEWLRGLEKAPKKLQALAEINALMAHSPWLINKSHIARLVGDTKGSDSWSIAELVQALVILSTFQSLAGFVFGLGVQPEVDMTDFAASQRSNAASGAVSPSLSSPSHASSLSFFSSSHATSQPMAIVSKTSSAGNNSQGSSINSDVSEGENLMRLLTTNADSLSSNSKSANPFHTAELDDTKISISPGDLKFVGSLLDRNDRDSDLLTSSVSNSIDRYLSASSDPKSLLTLKYTNFDVNSKSYSIFYLHDYSWKEHGYALVNRFYQGFAQLLDSEWDHLYQLTYNTVANQSNIDTGPFRRAIWYYTHRLYGLCHSDYDYNKIPIFLSNNLKTYIKKVTCMPEQVTAGDFDLRGYKFGPDEKCHIVLLAIEARRQAILLYALHAVMRHMTQQE